MQTNFSFLDLNKVPQNPEDANQQGNLDRLPTFQQLVSLDRLPTFQQLVSQVDAYPPFNPIDPALYPGTLAGRITPFEPLIFQYGLIPAAFNSTLFPYGFFDSSANAQLNQATLNEGSPAYIPNPKKRERAETTFDEDIPKPKRHKLEKTKSNLQKTKKANSKLKDIPKELLNNWSIRKRKAKKVKSFVVEPFAEDHGSDYYKAMQCLYNRKSEKAIKLFKKVLANCKEGDEKLRTTCQGAINYIEDYFVL